MAPCMERAYGYWLTWLSRGGWSPGGNFIGYRSFENDWKFNCAFNCVFIKKQKFRTPLFRTFSENGELKTKTVRNIWNFKFRTK